MLGFGGLPWNLVQMRFSSRCATGHSLRSSFHIVSGPQEGSGDLGGSASRLLKKWPQGRCNTTAV